MRKDRIHRNTTKIFKNLKVALDRMSIDELNVVLSKALRAKNKLEKSDEVNYIISIICEVFEITRTEFNRLRTGGNSTEARQCAMCIFHLHPKMAYPQRQISYFFKTSTITVLKAINKYRNIDLNIKFDREFKEKHDKVLNKFNEWIVQKEKMINN